MKYIRIVEAVCWNGGNEEEIFELMKAIPNLKIKIKKTGHLKLMEGKDKILEIPKNWYIAVSPGAVDIYDKVRFESCHQVLPEPIYLSKGADA